MMPTFDEACLLALCAWLLIQSIRGLVEFVQLVAEDQRQHPDHRDPPEAL